MWKKWILLGEFGLFVCFIFRCQTYSHCFIAAPQISDQLWSKLWHFLFYKTLWLGCKRPTLISLNPVTESNLLFRHGQILPFKYQFKLLFSVFNLMLYLFIFGNYILKIWHQTFWLQFHILLTLIYSLTLICLLSSIASFPQ